MRAAGAIVKKNNSEESCYFHLSFLQKGALVGAAELQIWPDKSAHQTFLRW
jgi:hypothetical protein